MGTVESPKLTLSEYFAYTEDKEQAYELEAGSLQRMPPESDLNLRIVSFLIVWFFQQGISPSRLRVGTEIVVGSRGTVRIPDLMVLSEALETALTGASRSTVSPEMPPPDLVVEVVSPGQKNRDRDYRYKRSEYGARGIGEYWIVDPITQTVSVLELVNGFYEVIEYRDETAIASAQLGTLPITANQVLRGKS